MKKAQIEIIGLIFITIIAGLLITFGLVYSFSATQRQEFQHEKFGERVIANNFVTVIAKTYIPTCDAEFTTLVKDCASEFDEGLFNTQGYDQGRITCTNATGTYRSCHFINVTSVDIVTNTLDEWQTSYRYIIERNNEHILNITRFNCTEDKEKESPGRQIVPLYPMPGEALIILEVCKS